MLKEFKFFTDNNTEFISATTWDTNSTFNIPRELYENVVELGLSRYHSNIHLNPDTLLNILENPANPINNLIRINEINVGVMYQYRLLSVEELDGINILIYYWVKLPDSEDIQSFRTIERIR
jgi:hypothetical protein